MTSRPHLVLKALTDFWSDVGVLDDDEKRRIVSASGGLAPAGRQQQAAPRAPGAPRPEPRRLVSNPIADARKLAAAANSIAELKAAIEQFNGCPLKAASKNTAVYDGAVDADVMIVGEAPGAEEDAKGLPFVGRAGQLLDRMLASIGLSRTENVYITNLIYWRPPGNRDPSPDELAVCAPFLARQIELKKPKLLLTAGKFATQTLLKQEDGIMRLRGRKLRFKQEGMPADIPCVPMLHPAYLLRRPADKAKAWEDLMTIAVLCDELKIKRGKGL